MAKNDFQYGGWNSYTLQCGMWLALESWQWIHQAAVWYMTLGWHAFEFAQTSAILELNGPTTTSATEASLQQAHACGTVCRCIYDRTRTMHVSSANWKHFCLWTSQPRRIVTIALMRHRSTLTYLYQRGPPLTGAARGRRASNHSNAGGPGDRGIWKDGHFRPSRFIAWCQRCKPATVRCYKHSAAELLTLIGEVVYTAPE